MSSRYNVFLFDYYYDHCLRLHWFADVIPSFDVTNGPIRLWRNGVTSPSYTSGRVQIYHRRSWGNICDDSQFGLSEATVICHQLGYTGASSQSRAGLDRYCVSNSYTGGSDVLPILLFYIQLWYWPFFNHTGQCPLLQQWLSGDPTVQVLHCY